MAEAEECLWEKERPDEWLAESCRDEDGVQKLQDESENTSTLPEVPERELEWHSEWNGRGESYLEWAEEDGQSRHEREDGWEELHQEDAERAKWAAKTKRECDNLSTDFTVERDGGKADEAADTGETGDGDRTRPWSEAGRVKKQGRLGGASEEGRAGLAGQAGEMGWIGWTGKARRSLPGERWSRQEEEAEGSG